MSVGRVFERDSLLESMSNREKQYVRLQDDFTTLKTAFQGIVDLDDFRGRGAEAIKNFYLAQIEVVDEWLNFIEMQIKFLSDIPTTLQDLEMDEEKFIQSAFLKEDLKTAHDQVKDMVYEQRDSLGTILDSINDIISLSTFSTGPFDEGMENANDKREDTLERLEALDNQLFGEYWESEKTQNSVVEVFKALLDATEQGGEIHPINFNLYAYERDAAHEVKEAANESREAYFEYKEEQQEVRDAIAEAEREAERIENMAWYEKAWEYGSTFVGEATGYYDSVRATTGVDPVTGEELTAAERTKYGALAAAGFIPFVGWAGRAFKGGKAAHSTYKGMKATDSALTAYQTTKSLDTLRKAEYGLYGITSANGLGEYVTGQDMFGNELSEEQRERSLNEALALLGGNATSVGLRKASPYLNIAGNNYNPRIKSKVEGFNPKTATNKQKGNFGEIVSSDNILNNQSLKDAGYDLKQVGRSAPSTLDDKIVKGIDGLYENTNPNSNIRYVVDEAKFGSGRLSKTQDGKQMSNDWLTGSHTGNDRLLEGVNGNEDLAIEMNIALRKNQVERVLSKVDSNGNVKTYRLNANGNKIGEWP